MFGPSTGTLNVRIASTLQILWTKTYVIKSKNSVLKFIYSSGNLGNRWRYGHVTVRSNDPYQIAFEGIVGPSFLVSKKKKVFECISVIL
jgi:hypothetical protein